jgi:hypothetical protein
MTSSVQSERCFTPSHFLFLELLEGERQWFEILMLAGLTPGASPTYQVSMMLIERCRWLRN